MDYIKSNTKLLNLTPVLQCFATILRKPKIKQGGYGKQTNNTAHSGHKNLKTFFRIFLEIKIELKSSFINP